ncbi:MAG: M48 family metallopeptidase [Bacilli bacterium]|jgi:predicted metal-dependent hydrolase|nr:M48 family metallopeptidase [Bacilli bacterium]
MEVILGGKQINVIVNHKKIKNIYFRFDDLGNLCVNANKWITNKEILKLIEKNCNSLEKMLNKVEKKRERANEFRYLGNSYELIYDDKANEVEFNDGKIIARNEEMINKFLKLKIKEIFVDEVNKMKSIIDTPEFTLKFRKMKTRWGVCNYKLCTITLNTELIRYSRDEIRYVIVHEMCHFYHHDHSKNFWNMVEYYYPNYKNARKELRD